MKASYFWWMLAVLAGSIAYAWLESRPLVVVRHERVREQIVQQVAVPVLSQPAVASTAIRGSISSAYPRLDFLCQLDYANAHTDNERRTALDGYGPFMTPEQGRCTFRADSTVGWHQR